MNKYKTFEKLKEELGDKFEEYMYKANIELLNKIDKAIEYIEGVNYNNKIASAYEDNNTTKCTKKDIIEQSIKLIATIPFAILIYGLYKLVGFEGVVIGLLSMIYLEKILRGEIDDKE